MVLLHRVPDPSPPADGSSPSILYGDGDGDDDDNDNDNNDDDLCFCVLEGFNFGLLLLILTLTLLGYYNPYSEILSYVCFPFKEQQHTEHELAESNILPLWYKPGTCSYKLSCKLCHSQSLLYLETIEDLTFVGKAGFPLRFLFCRIDNAMC